MTLALPLRWRVAAHAALDPLGASGGVCVAVPLADGVHVVSAGRDGGPVRLWELATGAPVSAAPAPASRATAMVARADGVAVAWLDGRLALIRGDGRNEASLAPAHAQSLVLHPDGRRFIVGASTGSAAIWDPEASHFTAPFAAGHMGVSSLAVHPDGLRLVAADLGHWLAAFDLRDGRGLWKLRVGTTGEYVSERDDVTWTGVLPDGRVVWTSYEQKIRIVDADAGTVIREIAHPAPIASATIAGHVLVTGGRDGVVRVWDMQRAAIHGACGSPRPDDPVRVIADRDPRRVIAASASGAIDVWDVETGEHLGAASVRLGGGIGALDVCHDGSVLAGDGDGNLAVFEPLERARVLSVGPPAMEERPPLETFSAFGAARPPEGIEILVRIASRAEGRCRTMALAGEGVLHWEIGGGRGRWEPPDEGLRGTTTASREEIEGLRAAAREAIALSEGRDGIVRASGATAGADTSWRFAAVRPASPPGEADYACIEGAEAPAQATIAEALQWAHGRAEALAADPALPRTRFVGLSMFGRIELEDGGIALLDGGTHGRAGHALIVSPSGEARWERTVDSMAPHGKTGSGTISLSADERRQLATWAETAWNIAGAHGGRAFVGQPAGVRWVWAIAVRRGDEHRVVEGVDATHAELSAPLTWLTISVDVLVQ